MMRFGPLGWPDLHGLTGDVDEHTQEHEEYEEHQEERPEHKNTHKIQEGILDGCFSNGQPNRSNKVTRG